MSKKITSLPVKTTISTADLIPIVDMDSAPTTKQITFATLLAAVPSTSSGGGSGGDPTGTAGGQLGGTYPNPTVIKINGASVPVSGSLVTGNVLKVSGTAALSYGAINLAGGANHVSGSLPAGNQASQALGGDLSGNTAAGTVIALRGTAVSTTAPTNGNVLTYDGTSWVPAAPTGGGGGSFTAGGDLGGTSTSQTVVSITGSAGVLALSSTAASIRYNASSTAPTLRQGDNTTASATAQPLTIQAQNATGTTSTGGQLVLTSGNGTTAAGTIHFQTGAIDRMILSSTAFAISPTLIQRTGNASCKPYENYTSIQTTNATQAVAFSQAQTSNALTHVDVLVSAFNSTSKTAGATFKRAADFRNNAGTVTQINSTIDGGSNADSGLAWSATIDFNGTNVRVLVTGAAATNIRWGIFVSTMETLA